MGAWARADATPTGDLLYLRLSFSFLLSGSPCTVLTLILIFCLSFSTCLPGHGGGFSTHLKSASQARPHASAVKFVWQRSRRLAATAVDGSRPLKRAEPSVVHPEHCIPQRRGDDELCHAPLSVSPSVLPSSLSPALGPSKPPWRSSPRWHSAHLILSRHGVQVQRWRRG